MNYRSRFVALAVLNAALMLPMSILAADMAADPVMDTWRLDLSRPKLDLNWPALKSFTYDGKNESKTDTIKLGNVSAPEIDPASTMAGLTLLAGCLVVLRGRKARK
jgi:hypothetical protein